MACCEEILFSSQLSKRNYKGKLLKTGPEGFHKLEGNVDTAKI